MLCPLIEAFKTLLLRNILENPQVGSDSTALLWLASQHELFSVLVQKMPSLEIYDSLDRPFYMVRITELDALLQPYYHQVREITSNELAKLKVSQPLRDLLNSKYDVEEMKSALERVSFICFLITLAGIQTFEG